MERERERESNSIPIKLLENSRLQFCLGIKIWFDELFGRESMLGHRVLIEEGLDL